MLRGVSGRATTPRAETAISSGSVVVPCFLGPLACWGPWTDRGAAGVLETRIVSGRERRLPHVVAHTLVAVRGLSPPLEARGLGPLTMTLLRQSHRGLPASGEMCSEEGCSALYPPPLHA